MSVMPVNEGFCVNVLATFVGVRKYRTVVEVLVLFGVTYFILFANP